MSKLSEAFSRSDFRDWPLDQETAAQILGIKLVRGHEALIDQFKELKVSSSNVQQMANIYDDNHLTDIMQNGSVVQLLASRTTNLRQQFREHRCSR